MKASVVVASLLAGASQLTTSFAVAIGLQTRQAELFGLYAYGDGLNGLRVFSRNNETYVGESAVFSTSNTDSTPLLFSSDSNDLSGHDVAAHPTTDFSSAPSPAPSDNGNLVLAIPKDHSSSGSHTVVLTDKTNPPADLLVGKFVFYGVDLFVADDSGSLLSGWYTATTGDKGVYKLNWGQEGGGAADEIKVSLRTAAPDAA